MNYDDFIASKRLVVAPAGISTPPQLSGKLFPFQRDIVGWALRRGRAAIWADCGLGKGWMAIEWARVVAEHQSRPVLITAPLAVAQQFVSEGQKLGVRVQLCRDASDVGPGVNVANYERLHRFDASIFGGVVLDESSILKDFTSATRGSLIDAFQRTPFRLACSATPAPNDHVELVARRITSSCNSVRWHWKRGLCRARDGAQVRRSRAEAQLLRAGAPQSAKRN